MLTSGELAKKCQVSLRTIQFYDQKGIVKPSFVDDNKKRFYDDDAINQMHQVCLYRTLGFSLDEIKRLLQHQDIETMYNKLKEKEQTLRSQQTILQEQYSYLESMMELVQRRESVETLEELALITKQRKAFKKQRIVQYIFLISFIVIEFVLFLLANDDTFLMLIACFSVLWLLLLLIRYHARHNAYICPQCHTYFELTTWQDFLTLNNGRKGKRLTCPTCGRKGNFKEQYTNLK